MKKVVAIFDFDGTLSKVESGRRFFRYILGDMTYRFLVLKNSLWVLCYALNFFDEYAFNKITIQIFKNKNVEDISAKAKKFALEVMPSYLRENMLERLYWHQKQQHRCILISRALSLYLEPWAELHGIDKKDVHASELLIDNYGNFTGQVSLPSMVGIHKFWKMSALLPNREDYIVYAYGDSEQDLYLLAAADFPYWIDDNVTDIETARMDKKGLTKWKMKLS